MTTTRKTPPRGGKHKESQGKEEGLASAKEVCCTAVQVDNDNAAFLLMVEAMVATPTALSSSLEAGTTTIISRLLLP